ncbi:MAG: RluA family pseudouridine synthase [Myxococcales bacterium]|nr:RluA family pseudouridine synthase [Myxococcales bacterium]
MAQSHDKPRVLHEDDAILVVNKPPGWLVAEDGRDRTVLAWAQSRADGTDGATLHLVHRLDRDTSGVMILAKGKAIAAALTTAFSERKVYKLYLALTFPVPAVRWAKVVHRLRARRIDGGERMEVVEEGGQLAESEVEVLSRGRRYGLVRVLPQQGRKHHVRVALADLGAPIVGDFLYGGRRASRLSKRVMLHARSLELAHPTTGEHLRLRAPLAPDMRAFFEEDAGQVPSDTDRRHRRAKPKRRGPQGKDKRRG